MRLLIIFCVLLPVVSLGGQCYVDELAAFTWADASADELLHISADNSRVDAATASFSGNVSANRGQEVFRSKSLHYQRQNRRIKASEGMLYGTPEFALRADKANYSLLSNDGNFSNADYYLTQQQAVGSAKELTVNRNDATEDLSDATYTTCARNNPKWFIKVKDLHLDHDDGVGVAKHAKFYVGDMPLLYVPYFSFPLDERRKSGFLTPSFDTSTLRGFETITPFYLNIAPNQDATVTPRIMSKRGFMLGGEYRYLLPMLSGSVAATYLYHDRQVDDSRWSFRTTHKWQPSRQFSLKARYERVSDKNYINDFSNTLDLSSESFVESSAEAIYRFSDNSYLGVQIKDFQIADADYTASDKPYSVLPRVYAQKNWYWDNWQLAAAAEAVNFDKDDTVSGMRFDQRLSLGYNFENSYSFINPEAVYRFTSYQLRDQSDGVPDSITRAIPTFSIDSGLTFERQTTWFGKDATQTLEPRLYYLYTPYREQSDIPDFDTALIDSSYSAMFLNNRFNGKDRIGDANQLTTAVSTAYLDNSTGKTLAKLAVGQIQYFEDRRVSLSDSIERASRSDVIADASMAVSENLNARGLIHRNIDTNYTEKSLLSVTYSPDADKSISFSHLYDDTYYKQIDFAGVWRINDAWRGFWRWNYSIAYDKSIDILAGIEYVDCCWGMRLIARQRRNELTGDAKAENSLYLEFVLRGLGNIGNDTAAMLGDIIPGYHGISYEKP